MTLRRLFLLIPVLFVALSCGDSPTDDSSNPAKSPARQALVVTTGPKVLFLGDSIAAGLHLERPDLDAFPALLQADLHAEDMPFRLVNAGVSGDTSAGGRARVDWMLKQKPDVLVVELGANDGLRGVELTSVEENLNAIAAAAQKAGVPVLLLGMRLPPNLSRSYTEGFAAIYDRVGARDGVTLVPFFMEGVAGVPDLNHPDGIHPNAEGHRILANTIRPQLKKLLPR